MTPGRGAPPLARRKILVGSLATLVAATGSAPSIARTELVSAAGGCPSTDVLVLEPGSPRFADLIRGVNRRWSAPHCDQILVPLTEAGVAEALGRATRRGPGNFRVRGGGHCYEDFVLEPRTRALIDMSLLDEVRHDRKTGAYVVQSGGMLRHLYGELYQRFGVTLPGGACHSVGLGGHICGGGYGLLSRELGLTVDWLTTVEVATVSSTGTISLDAVARDSRETRQRDLFWAHTGAGGGNYGVVTRFEFAALPKAPQSAEVIRLRWRWAKALHSSGPDYLARIIGCFEHLARTLPPTCFASLNLNHSDARWMSLFLHNAHEGPPGAVAIRPVLEEALKRFGIDDCAEASPGLGCATSDGHLSWWQAVERIGHARGAPLSAKYKSAHMRAGFPPEQVATIYRHLTSRPSIRGRPVELADALLQVDLFGGRVNTVDPEATAVWQRSSIFKLQYQTYWRDPADGTSAIADAHLQWIRDFYAEMYAAYGGVPDPAQDDTHNVDGCYINYPDVDLNGTRGLEAALALYYGGNLARLKQTKADWDPLNYFQHAQSIPPA
jgi:hexose oxidase